MKKRKFLSALISVAFSAAILSGCNITDLSSESLLRPPKTMGDEAEIEQLISDAANKSYTLKYPKSGSYRSAIIMTDLDGDKTDEAVAFFREGVDTTHIHMLVMYSDKGKWKLSSDSITETTDVDSVDFADINGNGSLEILVGYTTYAQNVSFLSCHTYSNGKTKEIRSGQKYSAFYCDDFNSDGKQEIMTLSLYSTENEASACLLEYNEKKSDLYTKASVAMDPNVLRFKNAATSDLGEDAFGIIVDGEYATGELCTQAIYYNKELLVLRNPLTGNKKLGNPTVRGGEIICSDIDSDGVIEIPVVTKLPSPTDTDLKTVADKIVWNSFSVQSERLVEKSAVCANYSFNYSVKLPDKWQENKVTALIDFNKSSMSFYEWNGKKTGGKLFEIRVFDVEQWDKGTDTDNCTLISKDSKYAYTFINSNKKSQLALTDDEIKTSFQAFVETTA